MVTALLSDSHLVLVSGDSVIHRAIVSFKQASVADDEHTDVT